MKKSAIKFKKHILIPLGVMLLIMLSASIVHTYRLQRLNILKDARMHFEEVQQITLTNLSREARAISDIIGFIKANKNLQNAWLAKNRDVLLRQAGPILKKYAADRKMSHLYFIAIDKRCFLRIHKPESCGDIINRFTLNQAMRSASSTSGIELGPFGTLTLRVVHPWWISGELTGYIEAGLEIEFIAPKLKRNLDSELIFTVDKSYLNRPQWEEGMKMIGRAGNWDQFSKFVIVCRTLAKISPELKTYIQLYTGSDDTHLGNISIENRGYHVGFVPLVDVKRRKLGNIIVLKDITKDEAALHIQIITMITASAVIGILMFGFFYIYVGRIEGRLVASHKALENEIAERKQVEKALEQSRDELEVRVQERTTDFKKANELLQKELAERRAAEDEIRVLSQQLFNVIEEERKKLARNLHDEFGQALTMLRFNIEALQNSLPDAMRNQKRKCHDLIQLVEQQCNNISNIVSDLRPDMLDHLGFIPTLKWYVLEFLKERKGLEIDFQVIGIVTRPGPETETVLYRILQESLTNIAKHAKAKHVNITLTFSHPSLIFVIKDDGVGFEQSGSVSPLGKKMKGAGLIGMRERITAVDGVISIRSHIGKGTVIRAELPIF